jgi:AraC family transcriptional regulator
MSLVPAFEFLEPFEAFGYTWRGSDNKEIPALWGSFGDKLAPLMEKSPSMLCFGLCQNMDEATGEFSYMVGIMKGDEIHDRDGFETWSVPGDRWAVFDTTLGDIHNTFGAIFGDWAKNSGAVLRNAPVIERYPVDFDGTPEAALEILVAIE